MAILNFKMGEYKNLASTPKVAGTVYITKDEQAMYVDISDSKRIRMNQIISYETFSDFTTALSQAVPPYDTQAFYYIIEDNALLKYNTSYGSDYDPDGSGSGAPAAGKWVQINSTAQIEGALAGVTTRVSALETWKDNTINPWKTSVDADLVELTAEDVALNKRIDDEIARATAAENKIATFDGDTLTGGALKTETDRAKAAEDKIATFNGDTLTGGALKTEVDRAKAAESALGERIDNVIGDLDTTNQNLTDEIARAKAAEAANKTAIETEASRATATENKIATFDADGKVNGGALKDEIDRAKAAESDLAEDIGENVAAIADVAGDLAGEITRATNAEEKIATFDDNGNLTDGALYDEQQARVQAITNVQNTHNNFVNGDYKNFKTTVTDNINTLQNWKPTVDDAIESINGDITTLQQRDTALQQAITNEESRAKAAENKIATFNGDTLSGGALKDEADRAKAAEDKIATFTGDTVTGGALKTEIDRAKAAEKDLTDDITEVATDLAAEITRAQGAEAANTAAIAAEKSRAEGVEAGLRTDIDKNTAAIAAEKSRAEGAESQLSQRITTNANTISNVAGDLASEITRAKAAEEAIAKFDGNGTLTDGALKDVYDDVIDRLQAADAMKYQGAISATSQLPAIGNVEKGWTYKVTSEIASSAVGSGVTINWHDTSDKVLRIGDLLIANGTEDAANTGNTAGKITSGLTWDHIPSGYVADYNPHLAADSGNTLANTNTNVGGPRTTATMTLTKGDDTVDTVNFITLDNNDSLKVSGDNNTIQFSLEWGSF